MLHFKAVILCIRLNKPIYTCSGILLAEHINEVKWKSNKFLPNVLTLPGLDGTSSVIPVVLRSAVRGDPHPASEHRNVRCPLQPGQRARPCPEIVPGQDPRLQQQEQVSC